MKQRRELYHKHRDTIRELLSDYEIKSATDLSDALKEIFSGAIEELLEAELDGHLGYEKHEAGVKATGDRRNGSHSKTIEFHPHL
jgi:putative transposase